MNCLKKVEMKHKIRLSSYNINELLWKCYCLLEKNDLSWDFSNFQKTNLNFESELEKEFRMKGTILKWLRIRQVVPIDVLCFLWQKRTINLSFNHCWTIWSNFFEEIWYNVRLKTKWPYKHSYISIIKVWIRYLLSHYFSKTLQLWANKIDCVENSRNIKY